MQLDGDFEAFKLFFDEFFPSVDAKIIDKFHADPRSPFHTAAKNDRIALHDPEADNPDWKVKQACTLMIAAASEIENGVENLWKCGPSGGRHDHPDFGKCNQPLQSIPICSTLLLV